MNKYFVQLTKHYDFNFLINDNKNLLIKLAQNTYFFLINLLIPNYFHN